MCCVHSYKFDMIHCLPVNERGKPSIMWPALQHPVRRMGMRRDEAARSQQAHLCYKLRLSVRLDN